VEWADRYSDEEHRTKAVSQATGLVGISPSVEWGSGLEERMRVAEAMNRLSPFRLGQLKPYGPARAIPGRFSRADRSTTVTFVDRRDVLFDCLSASLLRDATSELARVAVFSLHRETRQEAIKALAGKPQREYAPTLRAGLRYPWPQAARNAAEA